jgi:hypothetical protein
MDGAKRIDAPHSTGICIESVFPASANEPGLLLSAAT